MNQNKWHNIPQPNNSGVNLHPPIKFRPDRTKGLGDIEIQGLTPVTLTFAQVTPGGQFWGQPTSTHQVSSRSDKGSGRWSKCVGVGVVVVVGVQSCFSIQLTLQPPCGRRHKPLRYWNSTIGTAQTYQDLSRKEKQGFEAVYHEGRIP